MDGGTNRVVDSTTHRNSSSHGRFHPSHGMGYEPYGEASLIASNRGQFLITYVYSTRSNISESPLDFTDRAAW